AANTNGIGAPVFESAPAETAQTANADPTEISISPARMTSVMPAAIIRTATFARNRSIRFPRPKYSGRAIASAEKSATIAMPTHSSRRCWLNTSMPQGHREHPLLGRLFAGEHACYCAAPHHRYSIAHAENLRELRRDHQ